ncbi:ABC transporter permease [bacterium]|nr:ABC transporter permease [bacterium]
MPQQNRNTPPQLACRLITLLDQYEYHFSLEGDILEAYHYKCKTMGIRKARLWYWMQALKTASLYSHFIIKGNMAMFTNYLKIALRNMKKQKSYSFLNIFGLAVGMGCCTLILLWVQDEVSFDQFHENEKHIYRIVRQVKAENMDNHYVYMPNPLGPAVKANFREVKNATRYSKVAWPVMAQDKLFSNIDMCLADTVFFDIFTFTAVQGNLEHALHDPSSIVITEDMARKCFGNEDAIGKTITALRKDYTVAAVVENIPHASHIQFECVMPIRYNRAEYLGNWAYAWQYAVYIQFYENSYNEAIAGKIVTLIKQNHPEGQRMNVDITLQPLKDIHLRSPWEDKGMNVGEGHITYVYLFSLTAFCILIIACVNFMSLSTARSEKRQKEIGMRKVVGARRHDIIRQFLGESILLSFAALIVSLLLIALALPAFNTFTGKFIQFGKLGEFRSILTLAGITVFTGLVAGSYPAVFLSSFLPIKVLKGTDGRSLRRGSGFRSALVVGQFAFTTILITASLVIYSQLNYISNKDLGYDKESILGFHSGSLRNRNVDHYEAFKSELLTNPKVLGVTKSVAPNQIGSAYGETDDFSWPGRNPNDGVKLFYCNTDYDFKDTFGVRLVEGRFFSKAFAADTSNFLLNETAVKALGIESPVEKPFTFQGRQGNIIGIIKDFHISSLHSEIKPVVFHSTPGWNIYIKINDENMNETLKYLKTVWDKHRMEGLFDLDYYFLDKAVSNLYTSEYNMSKLFRLFTFLAVFISCLGLLGLASFMAEQRIKEIGIRKTLGAPFSSLILLLFKTFIKWVVLANLIAIPTAYFVMNHWLHSFTYHTHIKAEIFILTGIFALVIVLFSAGYQTVKAARANPVDSLKCE